MTFTEALILGIIQGLTEFLPVSSSGHLELGTVFLNVESTDNLLFSVIVHSATSLSTIVVFRKDILGLLQSLIRFKKGEDLDFIFKIGVSMIPVLIVGLFFKEEIESLFTGNSHFVAWMLLVTGALLILSNVLEGKRKPINFPRALVIGLAQACAVLPGISRSGATISTALMLGVDRETATRFSFLMVLVPILGATFLEILEIIESPVQQAGLSISALVTGFLAAFVSGYFACSWMIKIVNRGKLVYFAAYVIVLGLTVLIFF